MIYDILFFLAIFLRFEEIRSIEYEYEYMYLTEFSSRKFLYTMMMMMRRNDSFSNFMHDIQRTGDFLESFVQRFVQFSKKTKM